MKIQLLFGKKVPGFGQAGEIEPLAVGTDDSEMMDLWAEQIRSTGLYERLEIVTVILDLGLLEAILASPKRAVEGAIDGSRSVL